MKNNFKRLFKLKLFKTLKTSLGVILRGFSKISKCFFENVSNKNRKTIKFYDLKLSQRINILFIHQ